MFIKIKKALKLKWTREEKIIFELSRLLKNEKNNHINKQGLSKQFCFLHAKNYRMKSGAWLFWLSWLAFENEMSKFAACFIELNNLKMYRICLSSLDS